jgi:hypothetical protein
VERKLACARPQPRRLAIPLQTLRSPNVGRNAASWTGALPRRWAPRHGRRAKLRHLFINGNIASGFRGSPPSPSALREPTPRR